MTLCPRQCDKGRKVMTIYFRGSFTPCALLFLKKENKGMYLQGIAPVLEGDTNNTLRVIWVP